MSFRSSLLCPSKRRGRQERTEVKLKQGFFTTEYQGRQLLLADAENLRADLRRRVQGMFDDILRPNDRFL